MAESTADARSDLKAKVVKTKLVKNEKKTENVMKLIFKPYFPFLFFSSLLCENKWNGIRQLTESLLKIAGSIVLVEIKKKAKLI